MAQKRPSAVERQPSPSTSDQDREEEASSSSSEEEDDDEDDDVPAPPPAPAPHATAAAAATRTKKPSSKKPPPSPSPSDSATESDSGSGSGSESESDNPPTSAANPKPKTVATKPFEDSPKPKKPRTQPQLTDTPARSASKRAGENSQHVSEQKRAKKKVSDAAASTVGDGAAEDDEIPATEEGEKKKLGNDSKKLFQRIWGEEDEIAILKGLAEFSSKTGMDPYKDANAFHAFIKKSLRAEASSNQLKEKIRRLKKKFENNAGKGKNGEGPKFSKPHEQKAFELSKKVWANGGGVEPAKSDTKAKKNSKESHNSSKDVSAPKTEIPKDSKESEQKGVDENAGESDRNLVGTIRFDNILGGSGLNEDFLKRGLQLIGVAERAELGERWKSLQVAELELYVNRAELIRDQARLIWEAYKSSNH